MFLTEDNIKEVIPKLGPRLRIIKKLNEHRLNSSQASSNLSIADTLGNDTSDYEFSDIEVSSQGSSKMRKVMSSPLIDLKGFLSASKLGSVILGAQKQFNKISHEQRNHLVRICIDSLVESHDKLRNDHLEKLADKIVELFPLESKGVYYIPPNLAKKMSNGKLVDRYRNVRRVINSGKKEEEKDGIVSALDDKMKDNLLYLKHNTTPWAKIKDLWEATHNIRIKEMDKGLNVKDIFLKWKCLSSELGWELLDLDFELNYPEKKNLLMLQWPELAVKLWSILSRHKTNPLKGSYEEANGKV